MATRKNPLSALLSSDERKQAQEFQRDHVTRSAIRQAGTYGVSVAQPLPVSQTSLGRLASSLGAMSGILNQFTEFQAQKEREELRGKSIEQQIRMKSIAGEEGEQQLKSAAIQGGILSETVKQQNIRLAQMQQKASDAEFDLMLSSMNENQRRAAQEEVKELIEQQKQELKNIENGLEKQNTGDYKDSPFWESRAQRLVGSTFASEYAKFYDKKKKEYLSGLPELEDGSRLTPERAQELAESIFNEFVGKEGLDLNSELGKGFVQSTERFNSTQIPALASELISRSETLNLQNLENDLMRYAGDIGKTTVASDGSEVPYVAPDIANEDAFIQLNSLPKAKALAVLMGTTGDQSLGILPTLGIFGKMKTTPKGAAQFEMLFNELASKLTVGGETLSEIGEFGVLQSQIEEALEQSQSNQVRADNAAFNVASEGITSSVIRMGTQMDNSEIFDVAVNLIKAEDTPDILRERLKEVFPTNADDIESLADEQLFEIAYKAKENLQNVRANTSQVTDAMLKSVMGPNFPHYGHSRGADALLKVVKAGFNRVDSEKNKRYSALVDTYLSGMAQYGGVMGTGQFDNFMVYELDRDTDGAFSEYSDALNNVTRDTQAEFEGDIESEEFKVKLKENIEEIQAGMVERITNYIKQTDDVNEAFYNRINSEKPNLEAIEEEFQVSNLGLYSLPSVSEFMKDDPSLKPIEAMELVGKSKAYSTMVAPEYARRFEAKTKDQASEYSKTIETTQRVNQRAVDEFTNPNGQYYSSLAKLTDMLSQPSSALWFSSRFTTRTQVTDEYNQIMDKLNERQENRLRLSVDVKELSDIAATASMKTAGPIPIVLAESWLNKPQGLYPDNRERRRYQPGHRINSDGEVIVSEFWPRTRRDSTIPRDLFQKNKPPVEGLSLGFTAPKQNDIAGILERSGITQGSFRSIYELYGYKDGLSFLKDQYNNSYYSNQRVGNK